MERRNTDESRYQTLTRIENILRLLVERYGARMSLGEAYAIYAGMARMCKQDRVSLAEIAEATGLPKQNLSRWAQKRVGDTIHYEINDEDQRVHDLVMVDRERAQEYIELLAELFDKAIEDR